MARLTDGVFDPVVLGDLLAAGYDRSFEQVPEATDAPASSAGKRYYWTDVFVDCGRDIVYRTLGALVDLGGIAKGAAADVVAGAFAHEAGALVSLGGDIRAIGRPDDADAWYVSLDDGDGVSRGIVRLANGALATSSVQKRQWVRAGEKMHHLINPRTGRPAAVDAVQCSALADTAEHADVAAKVGLIMGTEHLNKEDTIGRALGLRGVAWITTGDEYRATSGWQAACA